MTLIALPSYLPYPDARCWGSTGTPALLSNTLDDPNERVTWIVRASKAGNLRKIGFRVGSVTVSVTLNIRVETVNNIGNPTGTLWALNTSGTLVAPAANSWNWVTLTADATLAIGDIFAVAIDFTGVGNLQINGSSSATGRLGGIPYLNTRAADGATWTRSTAVPNFGLEYSDAKRPWCDALPMMTAGSRSFNAGSSPDEVGTRFKFPFKCELLGTIVRASLFTTSTTYTVTLYDAADTVLATIASQDTDLQLSGRPPVFLPFATPLPVIDANTLYRLTVIPDATTNISLGEYTVDSAGTLEAHSGGLEIYRTERTDAGAWTDTTTARSMVIPLVYSIDDGIPAGTLFLAGRRRYSQLSDPLFTS